MTRPLHRRPSVLFFLVLFVTLVTALSTFAQTGTSSLAGTVTDAQGNVVSGATVTLTNPAKNFSRTQTTNESGSYSFNSIPPDTYTVEVTATGFKKTILSDVQALVAKPSEASVQLEIGNVSVQFIASALDGSSVMRCPASSSTSTSIPHGPMPTRLPTT